ncbi:Eco57I restriction-modification methylase domain-containing protein [Rhodocaloribacter sp.]
MQFLEKPLRNRLEKTVREARRLAVAAAEQALQRLAVDAAEPFPHLTAERRRLRNRLRARGRQLGDVRDPKRGAQTIDRLTHEVAYEAWHRLLFTRFLAENRLLLFREHPGDEGVPVTLAECDEIAREEGRPYDGFELAARLATDLLPQIFRKDDPVLETPFAPEDRRALRRLVLDLPDAVFHADDSLGWVYQFWQADEKDRVNASEVKIGAEELPAVTQLFTEDYMVRFLLENTLGAWWLGRHGGASLPVEMPYLRRLDEPAPAAGTFPGWPDRAAEITVLDPCMGSGHFLVAALHLLAPMRMREEGLGPRDAVDAVLRDNLFGLELDPRCTQLAAFALALAAWTFPGAGGYRPLPPLNLACSGLAPEGRLDDWLRLAGRDDRLRNGMRRLYAHFRQAPTLGSLLDPGRPEDTLYTASFDELRPVLEAALAREDALPDDDARERGVTAYGLARAAGLLTRRYTLVATNVPYLKRGNQDDTLKAYLDAHFPRGKADLATAFVERCLAFAEVNGSIAVVTPQNWLFLTSYRKLREHLLKTRTWDLLARLGPGAFETITGEVVNVALYVLTRTRPAKDHRMTGLDASDGKTPEAKDARLREAGLVRLPQADQLGNPDSGITLVEVEKSQRLSQNAYCFQGTSTGDNPRFTRFFWEVDLPSPHWFYFQKPSFHTILFAGRELVVNWPEVTNFEKAAVRGEGAWGRKGVALGQMRHLPATVFGGIKFSNSTPVIIPNKPEYLPAIWSFCESGELFRALRKINKKLSVDNGYINKINFDIVHWQKVAEEKYPNGLPAPFSDDPTQWVFHGHPCGSVVWDEAAKRTARGPLRRDAAVLHAAVARLLGYRWPAEQDPAMELAEEARALAAEAAKLNAHADEDGIVCLPAVAGERPAADRLRDLLAAAYGEAFSAATVHDLVVAAGVRSGDLEKWLRDKFFEQHCKLFGQRPFVWHVWDGERDGFSALVNYHKLDHKALEKLAFTYLGAWIRDQEAALAEGDTGAERRLYAARELQQRLRRILEGESPYDIFVRWKPLHEQPYGWRPDLNDGVRVNIRPFVEADVLRKNPRIHWKKDGGKNPPGAPWGEERRNDLHTTLRDKREARERAGLPVDA